LTFRTVTETITLRYRGFRFRTDFLNSWSVYSVCFSGDYEPILRVLQKSDIVLDAGANIGCFSILASKIASKIIAVEPNPDTFRHLLVNLRMNYASNVVPINVALLDKEGTALLEKHGLESRISNSGVRVRTTTIDKLTRGKVSIIKMDIEGSEIDALAGSEETLRNARAILLETHGTDEAVVAEIAKFGFKSEAINVGLMQKVRNAATLDFMYNEFQTRFAGIMSRIRGYHTKPRFDNPYRILYATKRF
jgi:FkbM family methyltransferase